MPNPILIYGEIWEQTNPTILARVTDENGVVFTNASVAAPSGGLLGWDLRIYDLTSNAPDTVIYSLLAQAVVTGTDGNQIFSSSLLTTGWSLDAVGYNFRYTVPSTVATFEGGHTYRYEWRVSYIADAAAHVAGKAYIVAEIKHKPVLTE